MQKTTLKRIIGLLDLVASDDETRRALNCVIVKKDTLIACDGHKLAVCKIQDEYLSEIVDQVYIHRDMLPYLKSLFAQDKFFPIVRSCVVAGTSITIDGKLVPKYDDEFTISLDADKLLDLVKSIAQDNKKTVCKLTFKNNIKGTEFIRITTSDDNNFGILAPCTVGK